MSFLSEMNQFFGGRLLLLALAQEAKAYRRAKQGIHAAEIWTLFMGSVINDLIKTKASD